MEKDKALTVHYNSCNKSKNFDFNLEEYQYQIFLFNAINSKLTVNNEEFEIGKTVYFAHPKDFVSVSDKENLNFSAFTFSPELLKKAFFVEIMNIFDLNIKNRIINLKIKNYNKISSLFEKAKEIDKTSDDLSKQKLFLILLNVLIYTKENIIKEIFQLQEYTSTITSQAIKYIHKNITESFTLEDIAKSIYISKYHLSHVFKKEMSLPIGEYVIREKMKHAQNLLKSGISPQVVSELIGYKYYFAFYRSYKRIIGNNPIKDYYPDH